MTIEEIYSITKPVAIYSTGSSLILDDYNDIDIVLYYDTKKEAREALERCPIHPKNYDLHFDSKEEKFFVASYIYYFMRKLAGKDLNFTYNILEHKQEYKKLLLYTAQKLPKNRKSWYKIAMGTFILTENKYEISEENKKIVEKIHKNRGIDDKTKELLLQLLA